MPQKLRGKVAIVAGAARNLGSLIAKQLGDEGASIVVHYHSPTSKAEAEDTAKQIQAGGSDAVTFQGDLTKVVQVERLFSDTVRRFGKVDIAVNTAGMMLKKPLEEVTEEEYDRMFAVNSKAGFFFLREAARQTSDEGKIISIVTSLLAAFTGNYSVYAGSKAPVEHFSKALAKELAPRHISVNCVAPGPLDTPFFHAAETEEAVECHKAASLTGALGDVKDIAPIVKFLATDGWWITGQTIFANGGYTTR
jgi:NAD(P)-dependent dehydrogenase (short-subunit alcohol dehydrogenase family)